jgi:hypothetical protein
VARGALAKRFGAGPGAFRLDVRGQLFGAAFALGRQGLTDGVFAFSEARAIWFTGLRVRHRRRSGRRRRERHARARG